MVRRRSSRTIDSATVEAYSPFYDEPSAFGNTPYAKMQRDGGIGIFELMTGQHANNAFVRPDNAFLSQSFCAGDACPTCRLATESTRADLRFGIEDLLIGDFAYDAVAFFERAYAFEKIDRAVDFDCTGDGGCASIGFVLAQHVHLLHTYSESVIRSPPDLIFPGFGRKIQ